MKSRFQTFVATRYLMAHPAHNSWLALGATALIALAAGALWALLSTLTPPDPNALIPTGSAIYPDVLMARNICLGVAGFGLYVFLVRRFFTFYATVSIVGVSIGAAALVLVLSIMNGFESDLRSKILGSNAHIQIAKEDGEFIEWPEIRARVDRVKGVVASTPFATSEVVIAANSNYFNVIVKGIDVATAVKVTDLERNLRSGRTAIIPDEAGSALDRLAPRIIDEPQPEVVPEPVDPSQPVIDPAPEDLPGGGEPVDYSKPPEPVEPPPAVHTPDPIDEPAAHPGDTGGRPRVDLLDHAGPMDAPIGGPGAAVVDPAPADFDGPDTDEPPPATDFSGRGKPDNRVTRSSGQRIQSLPGVLVGKELVKQIHCYTDQEVRLVSPLADPMNPDATGTPIPYNRDYRVAGEFFTGMYEYDLKLVYVSLESLQQFLRMGDAVDGIEVRVDDPDAVDTVVARIQAELGPQYRVQGWRELNRNLFSALKLEKIAMFMVLAIIILVASFSIVGNLIMTVVEKGREIALIKTLGAGDGGIVGVFMIQGFLIGVIGTTLGVVAGLVGAWRLAVDGFPINPDVYYIDRLPVEIDPFTVVLVYGAGLVISIAATIYPAVGAAQLRPGAGLKQ